MLAQWRQRHGNDIQAVIKVLAEFAGLDGLLQVLVGGRNDAGVEGQQAGPAQAFEFTLLQDAQQLGLQQRGHLADFVEEQRPVLGDFELALLEAGSAGEGALLVAEQFALQQGFRYGGAVDGDERLVGTQAVGVNGAGHQFLAGAALAADEHGRIAFRHSPDELGDAQHRPALADQGVGAHVRPETLVLGPQRVELQQVLQRDRGDARNRAEEVHVVLAEGR